MAFPPQWAQAWMVLPGSAVPGKSPEIFGWSLWWLRYDGDLIDPTMFDLELFADTVATLLGEAFAPLLACPDYDGSIPIAKVYVNTATGIIGPFDGNSVTPWRVTSCLPLQIGARIQLLTDFPSRLGRGTKVVSSLPHDSVEHGYLKASVLAATNLSLSNLLNPFVVDGKSFYFAHMSRTLAVMFPPLAIRTIPLLGTVKRRGRELRSATNWFTPLLPPP